MFRDLVDDFDDEFTQPDMLLDVPFVPTDKRVIREMLRLAGVGRKDLVYDLGSGEGDIVIAAARDHGARAIGIEIDPLRIADAMEYAADAYVEHRVDFIEGNLFDADFHDATVVTLYLLESINLQLRPRLLDELKPGTRVVSHAFHMGDWQPDNTRELCGVSLYKWVVPAKVAGTWVWEGVDGNIYQVELEQKFQQVSGKAWINDNAATLENATLRGGTLELQIGVPSTGLAEAFTLTFSRNTLDTIEHEV